jgi:hypothetical protein
MNLLRLLAALVLFVGGLGSVRSDYIYWSDYGSGDIRRASLDGSGEETLITRLASPCDMRLDLAGGQIYWGDVGSGDIRRANFDGSEQVTLVSGVRRHPGSGWRQNVLG